MNIYSEETVVREISIKKNLYGIVYQVVHKTDIMIQLGIVNELLHESQMITRLGHPGNDYEILSFN